MYNKIYLLLLVLLLFGKTTFAQNFPLGIYSEYSILPYDSANIILYYSFRVNNSFLVFEKEGNDYKANFSVIVEIYDSTNTFIKRESFEKTLSATSFAETNSSEIFNEGFLSFVLKSDKFNIFPIYTDHNSRRELKLRNHVLFPRELLKQKILSPIVVEEKEINSTKQILLTNYDGSIPFSNKSYTLLFPVTDKNIDSLFVKIDTESDTISFVLSEFVDGSVVMEKGDFINIDITKGGYQTRNFFLRDFSYKLIEGKIKIRGSLNKNNKTPSIFHREVKWINKPKSLDNIDFAIKMLGYIESDAIVNSIKKAKLEKTALFNYWDKIDPSRETKFNELMDEFYKRVDYTIDNFTTVGVKNGAESDRGKVWIVYGKPTDILRSNSTNGRVSEIWSYDNLRKTFTFIDKSGSGKFDLVEVK
jgi:GWxTD domain-containing protein